MKTGIFNIFALFLTLMLSKASSIKFVDNFFFPDLIFVLVSFFGFRSIIKFIFYKIFTN